MTATATGPMKIRWSTKLYLKKSALKMLMGLLVMRGMAAVSAIKPALKRYASLPFWLMPRQETISKTMGVKIRTALSFAKRMLTAAVSRET